MANKIEFEDVSDLTASLSDRLEAMGQALIGFVNNLECTSTYVQSTAKSIEAIRDDVTDSAEARHDLRASMADLLTIINSAQHCLTELNGHAFVVDDLCSDVVPVLNKFETDFIS